MRPAEIVLQEKLYDLETRLGGEDRTTVREAAQMVRKYWQALIHVRSVTDDALGD